MFKHAHISPVVSLSYGFGLQIFFRYSASLGYFGPKFDSRKFNSSRSNVHVGISLYKSADDLKLADYKIVSARLNAYVLAFGYSPAL